MAIAFGAGQSVQNSTTSALSVTYPAGITAGQMLALMVVNKYPTNGPATPSGWTLPTNGQASGGAGADGSNSGHVYSTVFYRVADGTESGSVAVTITGNNIALGVISRLTKAAGATWNVAAANGAQNTGGSNSWSVTCGSDPGIWGGDFVLSLSGININTPTFTSEAISATGVTFGTVVELDDTSSGSGDHIHIVYSSHAVTSGQSSAAPVYTMTASANTANTPAGSTALLRLREIYLLTGVAAGTSTVAGSARGAGALSGSPSGTSAMAGAALGSGALGGSQAGTSTATGHILASAETSGSVSGIAVVAGSLAGSGAITGAADGGATATGDILGDGELAGNSAGYATVSGLMSYVGPQAMVSVSISNAFQVLPAAGPTCDVATLIADLARIQISAEAA